MKPIEVFEDILSIITSDYAGAENLRFPKIHEPFLRVSAQLAEHFSFEDAQLFDFVQLYLQALGNPKLVFQIQEHAGFHPYQRGFTARSDGKNLYVNAVSQEAQVRPGDRIASISYQPPAVFRDLTLQLFSEAPGLSERDSWDALLNHARVIEVEREGNSLEKVILEKYAPFAPALDCLCQQLDEDSVYLNLPSLLDTESVSQWLADQYVALTSCRRLIVDLRQNAASEREAVLPLLPYLCDRNLSIKEFYQEGATETRYSERNCDLVKANLAPYLTAADEQVKAMAEQVSGELDAKRGQGFLPDEDDEEDAWIESRRSAEKIILLTDTTTAGEAEWLALGCRQMTGVSVVGRVSCGSMDTRNPVVVDYGFGRAFAYPISRVKRSSAAAERWGAGVPVDIPISWCRAEIGEDLILQRALET